jgi:hypothetical protein
LRFEIFQDKLQFNKEIYEQKKDKHGGKEHLPPAASYQVQ